MGEAIAFYTLAAFILGFAVLVVTASAPATLEPASYTFTLRPYPRIP